MTNNSAPPDVDALQKDETVIRQFINDGADGNRARRALDRIMEAATSPARDAAEGGPDCNCRALPPSATGAAEPVSWRWKPRGSVTWIYDPHPNWFAEHKDEIDHEPLYALPVQPGAGEREAREVIKPFAEAADDLNDKYPDRSPIWESPAAMNIRAADLRAARLFMEKK